MRRPQALVFAALLVLSVGCDHAAKEVARQTLTGGVPISWAGDAIRFQLALNSGAFLSLGAALPEMAREFLFVGLVPVLLLVVCALAVRAGLPNWPSLVGLALIAGGGLANWLDRMMNDGAVTDYVSLGLGGLRTGIFNLADVAILGGVALYLLGGRKVDEPADPSDGEPGEPPDGEPAPQP